MKTRSAELAWTGNLVITGAAVMAIGVAMTVWETRAEHTLVLDAAQEAPSIETLSIVEATERGSDRGKIMVSADGAFLSGKLLETMIAGGDEEYTRFVDAVRPMGGESIPVRIERMTGYVDELYARHGRNLTTPSLSAGSMVVLFGVAIIISAVAGEKICKRYITDDKHAADEPRGTIDELGWLRSPSRRESMREACAEAPNEGVDVTIAKKGRTHWNVEHPEAGVRVTVAAGTEDEARALAWRRWSGPSSRRS